MAGRRSPGMGTPTELIAALGYCLGMPRSAYFKQSGKGGSPDDFQV